MTDFYYICLKGDMKEVYKGINEGGSYRKWNNGLYGACRGGHMDIVKLMIKQGAKSWMNQGLYEACEGCHLDIVKLMIKSGAANCWNIGLHKACIGGNMDIIKLMIDNGGRGWNCALYYACFGGHMDVAELIIKKYYWPNYNNRWSKAFWGAYHGYKYNYNTLDNYANIIKFTLDNDAYNVCYIFDYPEDISIIMKLLDLGVSIYKLSNTPNIFIKPINKAIYDETYKYMPKELANIVTEYYL